MHEWVGRKGQDRQQTPTSVQPSPGSSHHSDQRSSPRRGSTDCATQAPRVPAFPRNHDCLPSAHCVPGSAVTRRGLVSAHPPSGPATCGGPPAFQRRTLGSPRSPPLQPCVPGAQSGERTRASPWRRPHTRNAARAAPDPGTPRTPATAAGARHRRAAVNGAHGRSGDVLAARAPAGPGPSPAQRSPRLSADRAAAVPRVGGPRGRSPPGHAGPGAARVPEKRSLTSPPQQQRGHGAVHPAGQGDHDVPRRLHRLTDSLPQAGRPLPRRAGSPSSAAATPTRPDRKRAFTSGAPAPPRLPLPRLRPPLLRAQPRSGSLLRLRTLLRGGGGCCPPERGGGSRGGPRGVRRGAGF